MITKVDFKKGIAAALKGAGLVANGAAWYLRSSTTIVVFNAQKSDYDRKYYLNVGIYLTALGELEFPAENKCHIQIRLGALFPAAVPVIERACALDSAEIEDLEELVAFLQSDFATFCRECLDMDALRARFGSGEFASGLVMKSARDLLGTPS